MTSSKIDIKVGVIGDENPELYLKVLIGFEFHKEKLLKLDQSLAEICGSAHAPMVLVQLPNMDFKQLPVNAKGSMYEFKEITKNNKLYHVGNLKSPQHQKFVKSLDKTFSKLTELDSWAKFNISLYDTVNIKKKDDLWNKALIKGEAKIDNEFIGLFHELIKTVSPDFADSPIVVLLQFLESLDLNLNLKRLSLSEPQFKELVSKFVGIETQPGSKFIEKMKQTKEEAIIRVTVGRLVSVKIQGPSRALAAFLTYA